MSGRVEHIYIASEPEAETFAVAEIEAVEGRGLVGDEVEELL